MVVSRQTATGATLHRLIGSVTVTVTVHVLVNPASSVTLSAAVVSRTSTSQPKEKGVAGSVTVEQLSFTTASVARSKVSVAVLRKATVVSRQTSVGAVRSSTVTVNVH